MFPNIKTENIRYVDGISEMLFEMTNRVRTEHGLPYLNFNPILMESSWIHSFQMCKYGFFDHKNSSDRSTRTLEKRIAMASKRVLNRSEIPFSCFGENIAEIWRFDMARKELPRSMRQFIAIFNQDEFTTADRIFKGWMSSKPHRKNLLNPNFNQLGVSAVARPATGLLQRDVIKFTQNFGQTAATY